MIHSGKYTRSSTPHTPSLTFPSSPHLQQRRQATPDQVLLCPYHTTRCSALH